ncbi:hypothetical protein CY35_05G076200 [Sphagnum magellanicum]|nr:hypothetical protein CY35_05G076200 [Sphagnum magellanicum]
MYHAFPEDVSCMVDEATSMMQDLFRKKPSGVSISGHCKQIAGIDTDGLMYFDSLMEGGCIMSNISIVEEDSEDAYQRRGELDEWMFINGEVSLMGSISCDSPDMASFLCLQLYFEKSSKSSTAISICHVCTLVVT